MDPPVAKVTVRQLGPERDNALSRIAIAGIHAYALTLDGTTVLASLRGTSMYPIASTTKIMTAYLAVSRLTFGDTLTVTPADVALSEAQARIGGEEMPVRTGERLTVGQTLYALLLPSANNAAVLLAERTAGTQAAFVRLMNETATRVGMTHTHYADASGLSRATQSSAVDLARLASRALRVPAFARIVRTRSADLPVWTRVTNLNRLLWTYPGAIGVKTGFTDPAGNCLVFAARRTIAGREVTIIGTLLGEPTTQRMFADATDLLNAGFAAATPVQVLAAGTAVGRLYPKGSHTATARLVLTAPLAMAPYRRTAPLFLHILRHATHGRFSWRLAVHSNEGPTIAILPLRAVRIPDAVR